MSLPESLCCVESRSNRSQRNSLQAGKNHRRALASLVAAIALVDCTSRLHATTQTSTWEGTSSSSWNAAGNWNPSNTFPDNGNDSISDFDVTIPSQTTQPV